MLRLAVNIASNPLSYLNHLHRQVCMSRLLKTKQTWPHIFRQPILLIPKFRYWLEWIVGQSLPSPTGTCQSHSTMAPISIVTQRMIFFPWQTIHASRVVDMTQAVTSYLRRVPLAVSVLWWSTVLPVSNLSRHSTNNCWTRPTRTLRVSTLSLSLFCPGHT